MLLEFFVLIDAYSIASYRSEHETCSRNSKERAQQSWRMTLRIRMRFLHHLHWNDKGNDDGDSDSDDDDDKRGHRKSQLNSFSNHKRWMCATCAYCATRINNEEKKKERKTDPKRFSICSCSSLHTCTPNVRRKAIQHTYDCTLSLSLSLTLSFAHRHRRHIKSAPHYLSQLVL